MIIVWNVINVALFNLSTPTVSPMDTMDYVEV